MSNSERPTSPHMSVYRWPISMTLSILHRMTGVALAVGLVVYVAWLMAAAGGSNDYRQFVDLMQSPLGRIALVGWSLAFFFHLCNGVRHLFWDTGRGFEMSQVNASAWTVIVTSVVMTLLYWWLA
ncbi:MAG: succinate dehydrogenase, cytochrome b556 subunit [Proteobacteria bacterium]|nr:succinate dehydrogenase, cytochrome b556 subunit [Pseudomonadota bacterium]